MHTATSQHHAAGYKSGGASELLGFYNYYEALNRYPQERNDKVSYNQRYKQNDYYDIYDQNYGGYGYGYPNYDDMYEYEHHHHHQHHDDSDNCPICVKTVTDVSVDVEFFTTTRVPGPIICAQYIIPW